MNSIDELRCIINEELAKIKYPNEPSLLYNPIKYILDSKGKRIRSVLTLIAYQLFKKDINEAVPAALAIEIFHNFTLLHDDIMDKAPIRRGYPTVHEKWNKNIAILSGDTMLIRSYQLMGKVNKKFLNKTLSIFNETAIKVCEGQQWDMDFESLNKVTISRYLKMIEYKTSALLSAALSIGALLAGANKKDQNNLYEFGKNIGIAFQLKDDLLDSFGNSSTFGKKVGGDILGNKKTFLYLKALELSNKSQRRCLLNYYSSNKNTDSKVKKVKDIFMQLNIPKYTMDLIHQYHKKSIENLSGVKSTRKKILSDFSNLLLDREN